MHNTLRGSYADIFSNSKLPSSRKAGMEQDFFEKSIAVLMKDYNKPEYQMHKNSFNTLKFLEYLCH